MVLMILTKSLTRIHCLKSMRVPVRSSQLMKEDRQMYSFSAHYSSSRIAPPSSRKLLFALANPQETPARCGVQVILRSPLGSAASLCSIICVLPSCDRCARLLYLVVGVINVLLTISLAVAFVRARRRAPRASNKDMRRNVFRAESNTSKLPDG